MEGLAESTAIGIEDVKRNGRHPGRAKARKRGVRIKADFSISD